MRLKLLPFYRASALTRLVRHDWRHISGAPAAHLRDPQLLTGTEIQTSPVREQIPEITDFIVLFRKPPQSALAQNCPLSRERPPPAPLPA